MTIIVSVKCTDGVVMAADGTRADMELGLKLPVKKLRSIPDQPIIYGTAGDVGLGQSIDSSLETFVPQTTSVDHLHFDLVPLVGKEQAWSKRQYVPDDKTNLSGAPNTSVTIAGCLDRTPWLLNIDENAVHSYPESGFDAIGIGQARFLALAIFGAYSGLEPDLNMGKVLAYRAISDAIVASAGGVSEPIQMMTVSVDGTILEITEEELEKLRAVRNQWRKDNRQTLLNLRDTLT